MSAYPRLKADDVQASPDKRDANAARRGNLDWADECFLCGRPLTRKAVDNGWWIALATTGELFHNDDPDRWDDAKDSQGAFPVGSECARRIDRDHKFKDPR